MYCLIRSEIILPLLMTLFRGIGTIIIAIGSKSPPIVANMDWTCWSPTVLVQVPGQLKCYLTFQRKWLFRTSCSHVWISVMWWEDLQYKLPHVYLYEGLIIIVHGQFFVNSLPKGVRWNSVGRTFFCVGHSRMKLSRNVRPTQTYHFRTVLWTRSVFYFCILFLIQKIAKLGI